MNGKSKKNNRHTRVSGVVEVAGGKWRYFGSDRQATMVFHAESLAETPKALPSSISELPQRYGRAAVLARLVGFPRLLSQEAVKAFFLWSDKGESYEALYRTLPLLARLDLGILKDAFKFGWYSREHDRSVKEDFRQGLLFLYDFEHAGPHGRNQALRCYEEALGTSTHWLEVKAWWEKGWVAGYPLGFPRPESCRAVCEAWASKGGC